MISTLTTLGQAMPVHMTGRQLAALSILATDGPQTVRALASRIGCIKPVITRIHQTLTLDGLVVVTIDADDRRSRHIALTPKGRNFVSGMAALLAEPMKAAA